MKRLFSTITLGFLASLNACGDDEENKQEPPCDFAAQTGCKDGLVCEQLADDSGKTGCFAPIYVEGRVVRVDDPEQGIEGARVVGRDENGASVSRGIALSDADGK
jgi:hypothetical protein